MYILICVYILIYVHIDIYVDIFFIWINMSNIDFRTGQIFINLLCACSTGSFTGFRRQTIHLEPEFRGPGRNSPGAV